MAPLNILTGAQLDTIVRQTLPPADQEHTFAAVATVDRNGMGVVAEFTKHKGEWAMTAEAYAEHEWSGQNDVGAKLLFTR